MTPHLKDPSVYLTAAFYLFVDLPNYVARRPALLAFCEAHNVKGSILLASEGINGTIEKNIQGLYEVKVPSEN